MSPLPNPPCRASPYWSGLAFVVVLAGCTAPPEVGWTPASPAQGTMEIGMVDVSFRPRESWVEQDTTLVFLNRDDVDHSVRVQGSNITSGTLRPGESHRLTLLPGDHQIYCGIHWQDAMEAEVHVVAHRY